MFPVKCNHDRTLITTILDCGTKFGWGLEVGSKPELLMGMSLLGQAPNSLLICNGYKDQEYIELVRAAPLSRCTPTHLLEAIATPALPSCRFHLQTLLMSGWIN